MSLLALCWAYLCARPLNAALNVLLLALGVAIITVLLLIGYQLEERLTRDAQRINLVVGAKGSPLQLVLAAVFHVDVPPGNIKLADTAAISTNRLVKRTVPLALGDSLRGFRIVGTSPEFLSLYEARVAEGRMWEAPMQAVIGAEVARTLGLRVGARFVGTHGLGKEGDAHESTPFTVVGVLAQTDSVIDRLILASVESVWLVHMQLTDDEKPEEALAALTNEEKEITALLVEYASPLAAMSLPRAINTDTSMQAAAPASEAARLFSMLGVGLDVIRAFALVLLVAAGLSTFIALYNALEERKYDLAVMRTLGASPGNLMRLVLFEGLVLGIAGTALGLLLGHLATELVGAWLAASRQPSVTGWRIVADEAWLAGLALLVAVMAAAVPAWRAYRSDVAATLARG